MIGLWLLPLAGAAPRHWAALEAVLDAGERERAARFIPPARRLQHVAAHGLKRMVLSRLTGVPAEHLRFADDGGGKPFLAGLPGVDFSLSHCDGMVGVAAARELSVGLDIEPLDRFVDPGVAAQFYSPLERRWLEGSAAQDQPRDRLRLWTLKEAFVKSTGGGIAQGLDHFSVDPDRLAVDVPGDPAPRLLWQDVVLGSHLAAVAGTRPPAAGGRVEQHQALVELAALRNA